MTSDNLPAVPEHGEFESRVTFTYDDKIYTIHGNKLHDKHGNVAVVISPGYGGGWSTWMDIDPSNAVVAFVVLTGGKATIHGAVKDDPEHSIVVDNGLGWMYLEWYERGNMRGEDLRISWLSPGTAYQVSEYDGSESLETRDNMNWHVA
jgi:hypothetical protein